MEGLGLRPGQPASDSAGVCLLNPCRNPGEGEKEDYKERGEGLSTGVLPCKRAHRPIPCVQVKRDKQRVLANRNRFQFLSDHPLRAPPTPRNKKQKESRMPSIAHLKLWDQRCHTREGSCRNISPDLLESIPSTR